MSEIYTGGPIPEHLPGEPQRKRSPAPVIAVRLFVRSFVVLLMALLATPAWPLYLLGVSIWGWPPNVPRRAQVWRYLRHTWSVRPPPPGLPVLVRAWIFLAIIRKSVLVPVSGLAWFLDELLYGPALRAAPLVAPLIEISAGRSGSTQLARYLEDDPQLAAPSLVQFIFPYLWLWRLVRATIGRFVTRDWVRRKIESTLAPEFIQRHEADPFRTDTFDGALYLAHLNHLCMFLGPRVMQDDFGFAGPVPHNRELWERDFVDLLEGIGRKTLVDAGPGPDGPRRFFVKGHFLCAGPALEARFPDARFLTMIREPAPRIRSAINYLRVNPTDPVLGPIPWTWLSEAAVQTEMDYCILEQAWFTREGSARRCVLRFSAYKEDLEAAMTQVYAECLDIDTLPSYVPRAHAPRKRTQYLIDRSLAELCIDEDKLDAGLTSYIEWCRAEPPSASSR